MLAVSLHHREQGPFYRTYVYSACCSASGRFLVFLTITVSKISSVGSQNLVTLIFTKTTFFQCGNTNRMAHILSNSHSSRPIRFPLKSINHASKYGIYEKFHHFTEIRGFTMTKMLKMDGFSRKNGQNDITQVKLFIMAVKSLLEVQNTNNSEFGCY